MSDGYSSGIQNASALHEIKLPKVTCSQDKNLFLDSIGVFTPEDYHADRMRHLGENAAAVVHEVRNNLQTLKAAFQGINRKLRADQDLKDYLLLIDEEINRANDLLTEVLRFARQERSTASFCDLIQLCQSIVPVLRSRSILKGVSIEECYPVNMPLVYCDQQKIKQILFNLFANALDAVSFGKSIYLTVTYDCEFAKISVQDHGCGMEKHILDKIFEPFFTTKEKGTGLGLPLCLKIAREHGGDLTAQSSIGEGSVFTLILPFFRPD